MTNEDEDDAMGEIERQPVEQMPPGTGAEEEAAAEAVNAINAPEEVVEGSLDPSDAGRGEEERRDAMARVKLYRLNDSGHWDDKGTGFASCEYMEKSNSVGLVVMSEQSQEPLLVHPISPDADFYSRQEDETIITWMDREFGTDIALSFQEGMGCNFIWEQIKSVQRQYASEDGVGAHPEDGSKLAAMEVGTEFQAFQFPQEHGHFVAMGEGGSYVEIRREGTLELPPPELANLEQILAVITGSSMFARQTLPKQLLKTKEYLPKLFELFRQCEDVDDVENLHILYAISRGIVMLNDPNLYEVLLSEEFVFDFVGTLEYDPEQITRVPHREFLKENVAFKEVVPIKDEAIRQKIHQTCRLGYLKDVILPRVLDDSAFGMLTSMMMCNNVDVVQALHRDPEFFAELFNRLKSSKPGDKDWNDLIGFLQELCTLARHLQNTPRLQVFATLQRLGLFDVLTDIFIHGDEYSQLKAADVIMSSLQNDSSVLREYMVQQDAKMERNMLSELVRLFLVGSDGIQATYLEILIFLMDPDSMEGTAPDKDKLLDIFYDKHMRTVVSRVTSGKHNIPEDESGNDEGVPPWSLTKIVDLLIFLVQNHQFRIKYYMLRNHVLQSVLQLMDRKEKYVVVSAVRFLRSCVNLKDEFYNRYLIKSNAFEPVMKVFKENGDRYNLLNSAVLELVDFIRRENIKNLIHHLVEQYEAYFDEVYYVDTFRLLKLKYQQGLSVPTIGLPPGVMLAGVAPMAFGRQEIAAVRALSEQRCRRDSSMSKDEENYFESDDDPADAATSDPGPAQLTNVHSPPVLHFQGSRFAPAPMAHSVLTDEVDTGPTHGELGKRTRSSSSPPESTTHDSTDDQAKKSKPGIPSPTSPESLTAAQRNAFKSQTTQSSNEEKATKSENEKDVKETANPTSQWVTVDEPSDE